MIGRFGKDIFAIACSTVAIFGLENNEHLTSMQIQLSRYIGIYGKTGMYLALVQRYHEQHSETVFWKFL